MSLWFMNPMLYIMNVLFQLVHHMNGTSVIAHVGLLNVGLSV